PAGCAPVAAAFAAGAEDVRPVRPATLATSLAMGDPPDGPDLLQAVRESGGVIDAVPEDEIVPAIELLAATEGIVVEAAGGVAIAALRRLARAGVVRPDERVVVYLTAGPWSGIPADSLGVRIEPTVEALAAALPDSLKGLR
ncbi:MAG: threonine synthase, partial [Acidimicrobiales bacterium]